MACGASAKARCERAKMLMVKYGELREWKAGARC